MSTLQSNLCQGLVEKPGAIREWIRPPKEVKPFQAIVTTVSGRKFDGKVIYVGHDYFTIRCDRGRDGIKDSDLAISAIEELEVFPAAPLKKK